MSNPHTSTAGASTAAAGAIPARRELQFLLPEERTDLGRFFSGAGLTHLLMLGALAFVYYLTPPLAEFSPELPDYIPSEIVYLDVPGPGGGGGGGGNKSLAPPKTEPLPAIKPKEEAPAPVPTPEPEITPEPEPTPLAAEIPATPIDVAIASVAPGPPRESASLGRGSGTGAGTGRGSGIGSGDGSGLGEGRGGGTGGGVYQVGSGVSSPQPLNRPKPLYTAEAMLRRIQGEVLLSCVVLATGDMGKCDIVKSLDNNNYGLDNEALKAASKWKFRPGMKQGEPVAVQVTIGIDFNMR